jgi:surface antigen
MRTLGAGTKAWLLGTTLLFASPLLLDNAQAAQPTRHGQAMLKPTAVYNTQTAGAAATPGRDTEAKPREERVDGRRISTRSFGISCVPYARQVSGIRVAGNAWQWWTNADGLYARGDRPEPGSVLDFRANGRMRLGHVAVVARVVNPRQIIIDHANWPIGGASGRVSRNVAVVDVSEANNWSAVRVELGQQGKFGSVYPTYGFIYNRPDTGAMIASVRAPAPQPAINPIPSDLRPVAERPWRMTEEVAEFPATQQSQIVPTMSPIGK